VTPEELVGLAIAVAEDGLAAGELPIGAVVVLGEDIVGRCFAMERSERRRLVHAEQLAMERADRTLGWQKRSEPLCLAVNLEPCLMCLGTAMVLGVDEVYYGLEAPGDGAAGIADAWHPVDPDMPFSRVPPLVGGLHRLQCRDQFARYVQAAPASGYRTWAEGLASRPD
jgi:tRNA(adenine34) deaminase